MKKIIFTLIIVCCLFIMTGCEEKDYSMYAGTYKLVSSWNDKTNYYEYYDIVINSNGTCTIVYKISDTGEVVTISDLKVEISGEELDFVKQSFFSKHTWHAYIQDDEIKMIANHFDEDMDDSALEGSTEIIFQYVFKKNK